MVPAVVDDDPAARLAELAAWQHGLVRWREVQLILGPQDAEHWRRARRLVPVQPGVYSLEGASGSWVRRLLAACLAADAVASHRAAAELWGLLPPAGVVEVTARVRPGRRLWPPAILHVGEPREVRREGIPLTDPLDTLVDLATVATTWAIRQAVDVALATGLLSRAEAGPELDRRAAARADDDHVATVRALLEPVDGDDARSTASGLADRLGALLASVGDFGLDCEVWEEDRFVARVDAADLHRKLAVLLEPVARTTDRWGVGDLRERRLADAGWRAVRVRPTELDGDGDRVRTRLRRSLGRPNG